MTIEQFEKVLERVRGLAPGVPEGGNTFLDEIRQLTDPTDEAQLDTDNAAAAQAIKDARIVELRAELAELERR